MQFRMKKNKKEQRQKKKEEKALQKMEKEKAKEQKKKAREQKKQEKTMKNNQKQQRKGKKGQDEQEPKKKKPRGKKRALEEDMMDNVQDEPANSKPEEQEQEPVVKEQENVEEHGDSGKAMGCSEAEAKHEAQHSSPTRQHMKNAKIVRLRRMKSKAKMVSPAAVVATRGSRKRKMSTKHVGSQQSGASGASPAAPKSTKKRMSQKVLKGKANSPVEGQGAKKSKPSKSKKPDPCPKIARNEMSFLRY